LQVENLNNILEKDKLELKQKEIFISDVILEMKK
jgi:hypothetical protein